MRLREITRLLSAGATLLLASVSTPAFGQTPPTADLVVELVLEGETDDASAGITLGDSEQLTVTVTNNGPSHVTEFTLDATLDANLEVVSVTGCDPVDTTGEELLPCTVSGDLLSGATTEVAIEVSHALPPDADPERAGRQLPTDPSACPNGAVDLSASVAVSGALQGETAVDDAAGNNTASVTATLRNWTDLAVTSLEGPGNTSEGQTVTYTAQVRNNGPCPAPNAVVSFGPSGILSYVDNTVSASCTNGSAGETGFAETSACELGTLDVGETATVSANYSVGSFADDVTAALATLEASIESATTESEDDPPVVTVGADDPSTVNNSDDTSAPVDLSDHDSGGCGTGGAGTLLGLLALAAARLGRRRTA